MVISGCIGPRGDGYDPGQMLTPTRRRPITATQIGIFADAGADMVDRHHHDQRRRGDRHRARRAAAGCRWRSPSPWRPTAGCRRAEPGEAIEEVDAATGGGPAYYMINCAHPTHFARVLARAAVDRRACAAIRANASRRSHAELDEAPELDDGDPGGAGRALRASCAAACRRSPCSAAAAAPTTAMSRRSARA